MFAGKHLFYRVQLYGGARGTGPETRKGCGTCPCEAADRATWERRCAQPMLDREVVANVEAVVPVQLPSSGDEGGDDGSDREGGKKARVAEKQGDTDDPIKLYSKYKEGRSEVWKHYKLSPLSEYKFKARCNRCGQWRKYNGASTSGLRSKPVF